MKKQHIYITLALALILVLPSATRAQENDNEPVQNQPPAIGGQPPIPVPPGQRLPVILREKIGQNIGQNENVRNQRLENRGGFGSSTRPFPDMRDASNTSRMDEQGDHEDDRGPQNMGSSTPRDNAFGHPRDRGFRNDMGSSTENMRNGSSTPDRGPMRPHDFAARREALSKQLGLALDNLKQIRERINTRIGKAEQAGDDMTQAKSLLVIADAKITIAEQALATFNAFTPIASSTATTTVDMNQPRQIADTAIKSSKDAHKALIDVVTAIAHAMGLDLGDQKQEPATSTIPQGSNNQQ